MTEASKTVDHSIPIYGRPLQVGKFYVNRSGEVWECTDTDQRDSTVRIKNTSDGVVHWVNGFGNFHANLTSNLDLISEYTPPAKVVVFHRVYGGEPSGHPWSSLALAIAANPDADCILEMHEFARHPVNKGDV